jgi:hypothetical protein
VNLLRLHRDLLGIDFEIMLPLEDLAELLGYGFVGRLAILVLGRVVIGSPQEGRLEPESLFSTFFCRKTHPYSRQQHESNQD